MFLQLPRGLISHQQHTQHLISCPALPKSYFSLFLADSGSGAALVPASPDPLAMDEPVEKMDGGAAELGHSTGLTGGAEDFGHAMGPEPGAGEQGQGTALNLRPAPEETTPLPPTAPAAPRPDAKQTSPVKKKPPTLKQVNTGRKHPRLKPTPAGPPGTASPASPRRSRLPTATPGLRVPAEDTEHSPPELPWVEQATTSHPTLQISPSSLPPALPDSTGDAGEAPTVAPVGVIPTKGVERDVHSSVPEESQETTTSTIVTTTVTTTEPTPGELSTGMGLWHWWGAQHASV